MVINLVHQATAGLAGMTVSSDSVQLFLWKSLFNGAVLAQQVSETNVLTDMQKAFNNFVQTGQIWAMLIGIVIGYIIRNTTAS